MLISRTVNKVLFYLKSDLIVLPDFFGRKTWLLHRTYCIRNRCRECTEQKISANMEEENMEVEAKTYEEASESSSDDEENLTQGKELAEKVSRL